MHKIDTKGLLLRIFIPTIVLSLSYLILGHFCPMPHILLFCILGTFILVPIELGIILKASKREYGKYSLQSAFAGQEKNLESVDNCVCFFRNCGSGVCFYCTY